MLSTRGRTHKHEIGQIAVRLATRLVAVVCAVVWTTAGSAAVVAVQSSPAGAMASAKTWLGHESEIEAQLRSASVTRLEDVGTGVTRPRRAYLEPAEPVESLLWKVLPPGRRQGYWESYKSEIAAYELDKLLGMHMVPPAVERSIRGETGAAIMWLGSVKSVKELGGRMPAGAVWGAALRRRLMFDDLIANIDRNAGNLLTGPPGELILIDHSRAFTLKKTIPEKIQRVDADLWEKIKALTQDDVTRVLGPWLDQDAIEAIVERRNRMVAEVDKLVAKKGRAAVIIP